MTLTASVTEVWRLSFGIFSSVGLGFHKSKPFPIKSDTIRLCRAQTQRPGAPDGLSGHHSSPITTINLTAENCRNYSWSCGGVLHRLEVKQRARLLSDPIFASLQIFAATLTLWKTRCLGLPPCDDLLPVLYAKPSNQMLIVCATLRVRSAAPVTCWFLLEILVRVFHNQLWRVIGWAGVFLARSLE